MVIQSQIEKIRSRTESRTVAANKAKTLVRMSMKLFFLSTGRMVGMFCRTCTQHSQTC